MRLREVAYRRLLVRIFSANPERWVCKGGVALLLRLDPNRTSNDIDISYLDDVDTGSALQALRADCSIDMSDFFSFDLGEPMPLGGEGTRDGLAIPVTAYLGQREWASFAIDLDMRSGGSDAAWLTDQTRLTGRPEVDEVPGLRTLSVDAQLADKLCALFEVHGAEKRASSRARDLADIAMIASQEDVLADSLGAAIQREAEARLRAGSLIEPLPRSLILSSEQVDDWPSRWEKATRGAPVSFEDALTTAQGLLDPVMSGTVDGLRWEPVEQAWV